ncbi:MAG: DegT/DnrJ/EryC1/StrS family aminotransferase [Bacteroidales bacterium]|nr:DegT/DnrJ/EryC1/StrS family aminotransferase [Bacteroidales bacterium]MCM1146524.1 DegT/DnrJ/EryC1/StrS family aminotransferase [Bacteroidales bacterium]MCM1205916.1 DegT/DnrJ/EryC1/StrS family aminotransferase [Bacillota bacterium]MCM1510206.1 DegT/DnrJ/EryC1/StrS family aminotransferase [Clostridium sp.]
MDYLSLKEITASHAEEIHAAVRRVTDSGWYLQGKENGRFEKEYAQYIGTACCVGCASGLDALTLILRAYMELGVMAPGDEILVPANTYIATILAITENGLVPVLVEPDAETLEIDESLIESHITPRTKALMTVHLYGRLAYSERMADICRKHGIKLLEDNAQAHGCRFNGRRTGALGDAAAHSFYPGKNLGALGDGGAVTTDDRELAETVRILANYGSQRKYVFRYRGRNSRLDELQAAVLSVKLAHLDSDNDLRRRTARLYCDGIRNPLVSLPRQLPEEQNVWHIFPVLSPQRDRLRDHLAARGIPTLIHYPIPPHRQECYKDYPAMASLTLPVTERLAEEELSLPVSPCMTAGEAAAVIEAVNSFR